MADSSPPPPADDKPAAPVTAADLVASTSLPPSSAFGPAPAAPAPVAAPEVKLTDLPAVNGAIPGITKDGAGVPFDPRIHNAVLNRKTNRWMPKPPPRGAAGVPAGGEQSTLAPDRPVAPAAVVGPDGRDQFDVMADMHLKAFYGLCVGFISKEWLPEAHEHESNRQVVAAYYRAKQMTMDSPGWAVMFVLGGYAGRRLAMPETMTKMQRLRAWGIAKVQAWRGRRTSHQIARVVGPTPGSGVSPVRAAAPAGEVDPAEESEGGF